MASRKEYEMLFRLNAQTANGFHSAFSSAQKAVTSIQNEIQELNRLQADISAYQKQQQAVENTDKKLEILKHQYENIQKEIGETAKYSSALENKLLSKQQQIDRTSEALQQQTQRLNQMGDALQDAGIDTKNLEAESKKLDASMEDLKQTQIEVAESAEDFGESTVDAFEAIGAVMEAVGIAAAVHEIYDAFMDCVSVAGEFEASMANVEALSGSTSQEMGQLSALAKELGATTQFTAKESADAMGYMAMAGWSAEQMLSGMPGVLKLAAASGEDLAMVSDIVTDSMTAFGLTAVDTAHYADVLAAAATSANTNVSLMGETFKYAAPMAGALGYDVEDVAVAVGMMANSGIKASQAGTSLNNIFTRLAKPTKESKDAMEALGISLLDGSGNMYTFMELMETMRERFRGLTETQKAFYAAELAGQRGMAGLLAVVNSSESDFEKLSNSITNSAGAAERMANIKLDTMTGQLTIMNSAAEAVKITIGEQFTPILKDLYSWGAEILTEINAFLQAHPGIIKAVTAITAGLGTATAAVTGFVAATKIMALVASTLNPVTAVIVGMGAALTAVATGAVLARNEFDDTTYAARQQETELERLRREYDKICDSYGETSTEASTLRYRIMTLTEAYESGQKSIQGLLRDHESLMKTVTETSQTYHENIQKINDEKLDGVALVTELQRMADAYQGTSAEAEIMQKILDELNDTYGGIDIQLQDVITDTDDWRESIDKYIRQAAEAEEKTEKLRRAMELLQQIGHLETEGDNLKSELEAAEEELKHWKELQKGSWDTGLSLYEEQVTHATDKVKNLTTAVGENNSELVKAQTEYAAIQKSLGDVTENLSEAEQAQSRLQNVIDITTGSLDRLVEAYQESYDEAIKSVEKQYNLWDEAAKVIPKSVEEMTKAMQSQIDYWKNYRENLDYLREIAPHIEGLEDILDDLADGSADSINAVAGIADAMKKGSGDVEIMVSTYQDLITEHELVADSMADTATKFSQQLEKMQSELAQTVRDMNVSDLAEESAASTIQAFINKADNMVSGVRSAYYNLGKTAANALSESFNSITANLKMPSVPGLSGYASGTDNATSGVHLVGEYGPELMYFHGGETVLTTSETRQLRDEIIQLKKTLPGFFTSYSTDSETAGLSQDVSKITALYTISQTVADIPGYASGTSGASSGWRQTGESGAEIIFPRAVLDAQKIRTLRGKIQTAQNMDVKTDPYQTSSSGVDLTFSPVYQITINGDTNRSEIETVLRNHDKNLRENLRLQMDNWWEEKRIDSARRRFR